MTTDTLTMGSLAYRLAEIGDHDGMTGVIARMTAEEAAKALNVAALLVIELGNAISPAEVDGLTECTDCGVVVKSDDTNGWVFIADGCSQYCPECDPTDDGEEVPF